MLATKFTCPGCHVVLRTPEPVPVGQPVQCPKCGATFPMPADTPSPAGSGPQPAMPQPVLVARRAAGPEFALTMDSPPAAVKPRRAGMGESRMASDDTALQTRKRKQAASKKMLVWASVAIGLIVVVLLGAATATIIMIMNKTDESAANKSTSPTVKMGTANVPSNFPFQGGEGGPIPGRRSPEDEKEPEVPPKPKVAQGGPFFGVAVGNLAPDFEGEDLDGQRFRLSDFRGKVVALDFWGDWCPHCRTMYPHNKEIGKRLTNKPFVLLGVNSDPTRDQAKKAVQRESLTFRSWWDDQELRGPIAQQYGIDGFPTMLLLDHTGMIRAKLQGAQSSPRSLKWLNKFLDQLVADAGSAAKSPGDAPSPKPDDPKKEKPAPEKAKDNDAQAKGNEE